MSAHLSYEGGQVYMRGRIGLKSISVGPLREGRHNLIIGKVLSLIAQWQNK